MKKIYPNCTMGEAGCKGPCECLHCGFDQKEAKRRATIPLTRDKDGKRRELIRRKGKEE